LSKRERWENGGLDCCCQVAHRAGVRKTLVNLWVFVTLVVAAGFMALAVWWLGNPTCWRPRAVQEAVAPLRLPADGVVDHRFDFLSAWLTSEIPRALRFDPPLGSEHGGLVYNAQPFWEMNSKRGGHHTGDDLNGIGGMDSDLGDPVFAVADGLVIYAGAPSPGWGNVLIIAHKVPDGRILHSMYAHMNHIDVTPGSLVARGGKVGTVGTANGIYPAHLHFEMRASDGVDIGAGYAANPLNRLDPSATVRALRNAQPDDLAPSPMARALSKQCAP
jgi:murein DD-endopeptidase MepM/ murein hydrolase activator NlpD